MERLNDIQKWAVNTLYDGPASTERLCDILVENVGQLIDEDVIEWTADADPEGDPFQADLFLSDLGDKVHRAIQNGEL